MQGTTSRTPTGAGFRQFIIGDAHLTSTVANSDIVAQGWTGDPGGQNRQAILAVPGATIADG